MNWGYKLLTVFIIFVGGIVYMVIKASGHNNDLVVTDYYEKELVYQEVIDKVERTNNLSEAVTVSNVGKNLKIVFPREMKNVLVTADVLVYYAADKSKDQHFTVSTIDAFSVLELKSGSKGQYEVKIEWMANDTSYYSKAKVILP